MNLCQNCTFRKISDVHLHLYILSSHFLFTSVSFRPIVHFTFYVDIWVTPRVKKQEQLTLRKHLSSPPFYDGARVAHLFSFFVLSCFVSLRSQFRVLMSYDFRIITLFGSSYLQFFVGGRMFYLRYVCLFAYNDVQHILYCVFVLFFFVLCTLCCQFFLDCPFIYIYILSSHCSFTSTNMYIYIKYCQLIEIWLQYIAVLWSSVCPFYPFLKDLNNISLIILNIQFCFISRRVTILISH